jgi:hypothetical protein
MAKANKNNSTLSRDSVRRRARRAEPIEITPPAANLHLEPGEVWHDQVWRDHPLYIDKDLKGRVIAAAAGPTNYDGLRGFVSDMVKLTNASDEELKPEERERLRKYGELLPAVVADLEKIITKKDQSDHVLKSRLENKLWQFGGLIFEIASYRGGRSVAIQNRIRAAIASKGRKKQSRDWHDIADPLAAKAWRGSSDYPAYHPHKLAASIKDEVNIALIKNKLDEVREGTIGGYLSKYRDRIRSFG